MANNLRLYVRRRGLRWYAANLVLYPCVFALIALYPLFLSRILSGSLGMVDQPPVHPNYSIAILIGLLTFLVGCVRVILEIDACADIKSEAEGLWDEKHPK